MRAGISWRLALTLFASSAVAMQASYPRYGSIQVRVTGSQGRPLMDAEVVLTHEGAPDYREAKTTDAQGRVSFRVLVQPQPYRVTVSYPDHLEVAQAVAPRSSETASVELTLRSKLDALAALNLEAAAQIRAGDRTAARATMERILAMQPDSKTALRYLALGYAESGEKRRALAMIDRLLVLEPANVDALQARWELLEELGETAEAAKAEERLVAVSPKHLVASLYGDAVARVNAGDSETAGKLLERVLELDSEHADAHYQLGMIRVGQARNAEARKHLERYMELDPRGDEVLTVHELLPLLQ